jgi:hypothetical protein
MSPRMKDHKTPHELLLKMKPSARHLCMFSCMAYGQVPAHQREKPSEKSEARVFTVFEECSKGWRILLDSGKIAVCCNVKFIELMRISKHVDAESAAQEEVPPEAPDAPEPGDDNGDNNGASDEENSVADDDEEPSVPDKLQPRM